MPIRRVRPTSNGRRSITFLDTSDLTKGKRPERDLVEGLRKHGGRNNYGQRHDAPPRRRPPPALPHHRLGRARQGRHPGHRGRARVRPEPQRAPPPPPVHGRREALRHRAARRRASARSSRTAPRPSPSPATASRCDGIPVGLQIHNVELDPGRGAQLVPRRRLGRDALRQGGRLRHRDAAVGRDAPHPARAAARRSGRSATSTPTSS